MFRWVGGRGVVRVGGWLSWMGVVGCGCGWVVELVWFGDGCVEWFGSAVGVGVVVVVS